MLFCKLDLPNQYYLDRQVHTCQITRFHRVTPGNRACHPHFPEHLSGHGFHYDDSESPGIGPDIRNIYLFRKYRDFTYRNNNNPNGQLQSTTNEQYTFDWVFYNKVLIPLWKV
jgi:hypothetical protein